MINLNGTLYPDTDYWEDTTGLLSVEYLSKGSTWVLIRTYKGKIKTWESSDPRDVVYGFTAIQEGRVGLRTAPFGHKTKQRGSNHKYIRGLNSNKCQMPGCTWPEQPGLVCDVHHIVSVANGGDESPENKVCLCKNHHAEADAGIITIAELLELNGVLN